MNILSSTYPNCAPSSGNHGHTSANIIVGDSNCPDEVVQCNVIGCDENGDVALDVRRVVARVDNTTGYAVFLTR